MKAKTIIQMWHNRQQAKLIMEDKRCDRELQLVLDEGESTFQPGFWKGNWLKG